MSRIGLQFHALKRVNGHTSTVGSDTKPKPLSNASINTGKVVVSVVQGNSTKFFNIVKLKNRVTPE
jgi:hypothetical protein